MNKTIGTAIDDNLKLLATLCLLKEVTDKHIYINDKIFRISQQILVIRVLCSECMTTALLMIWLRMRYLR